MESPRAAFVRMFVERLEALEEDNAHLRRQVQRVEAKLSHVLQPRTTITYPHIGFSYRVQHCKMDFMQASEGTAIICCTITGDVALQFQTGLHERQSIYAIIPLLHPDVPPEIQQAYASIPNVITLRTGDVVKVAIEVRHWQRKKYYDDLSLLITHIHEDTAKELQVWWLNDAEKELLRSPFVEAQCPVVAAVIEECKDAMRSRRHLGLPIPWMFEHILDGG